MNYNNENEFDPIIINNKYNLIKNNKNGNNSHLKKLFIQFPNYISKYNISVNENEWYFINIYNNYFCICKGENCLFNNITQVCKYNFYLYIIDENSNVYNKTDYLFNDFIFEEYSSDDTFPIFQKMIKLNFSVHYLTEKKDIYNYFCDIKKKCLSIILVNKQNYIINGDFLENYLTLILKLKAVITGAEFYYINNLFYNIDYITYISVGHGVSIFKEFLYSGYKYYGHKRYNKILLPPSDKIISVAKNHGWKDDNIIKINLPRWDKFGNINEKIHFKKEIHKIKKNSIFIMFTWREIKFGKNISEYYLNNIINLINNIKLNKILNEKNITLYFTLHHKLTKLQSKFENNKFIKYINENQISECLSKTNLIISDFSSIIFDIICRNKPFIIFVPDANDPKIKKIYKKTYYKIINSFKTDLFKFENKFFEVNETVNKIIYYINNNFKLEDKLKKFYRSFNFTYGNNIKDIIYYLINLK